MQQRLRIEAERSSRASSCSRRSPTSSGSRSPTTSCASSCARRPRPGEDAEALIDQVFEAGRQETLRDDLRLRRALDRAAAEVKRIPADLAAAREKLWTPEKERPATETKLWTPGSKEP